MLIFIFSVIALIAGIAVQFDSDPSNDDAGLVLIGVGVVGALVSGWFLWGAKLVALIGGAA